MFTPPGSMFQTKQMLVRFGSPLQPGIYMIDLHASTEYTRPGDPGGGDCKMGSKNAAHKRFLGSIRNQRADRVKEQVDLTDLRGLPGPQQKEVKALTAKADALRDAGMPSSAARLESQATQIIYRYRRAAKNGPNPLTGV